MMIRKAFCLCGGVWILAFAIGCGVEEYGVTGKLVNAETGEPLSDVPLLVSVDGYPIIGEVFAAHTEDDGTFFSWANRDWSLIFLPSPPVSTITLSFYVQVGQEFVFIEREIQVEEEQTTAGEAINLFYRAIQASIDLGTVEIEIPTTVQP